MRCEKYKCILGVNSCLRRQELTKTETYKEQFSKCKSCYIGLKVRLNPLNYLDNDIWHLRCQYPMKFKRLKLKVKKGNEMQERCAALFLCYDYMQIFSDENKLNCTNCAFHLADNLKLKEKSSDYLNYLLTLSRSRDYH